MVRGAKYETAAPYANQAFTKPTIANWGNDALSDYAVGFICDLGSPGIRMICRTGFVGRGPIEDYPLSNRFDEVDALVVFDDVLIPWENVLFIVIPKRLSTFAPRFIGTALLLLFSEVCAWRIS